MLMHDVVIRQVHYACVCLLAVSEMCVAIFLTA